MRLHRELGITQKNAWHLLHRLRMDCEMNLLPFGGPAEVDEAYIGGKVKNRPDSKKLHAGRGTVCKPAMVGAKDRNTGRVRAEIVEDTLAATLASSKKARGAVQESPRTRRGLTWA